MTDGIYGLLGERVRGELLRDEPMARHTSLRVGGPADLYLVPADRDDLIALLALLTEQRVPCLVAGGGYNLLVRDNGFRGAVISLKRLDRIQLGEDLRITAEAGVVNQALVRFALDHEAAGIEFLAGIPGTVGGALAMNAGAHGQAVLDLVETLTTVKGGELREKPREELEYGYRFLMLEPGEVIVAATFALAEGSRKEMTGRIEGYLQHRSAVQKVGFPNAGSFFRNPPGEQAWRLIDQAGLRGFQVGGAQVSEVHTNFLVNRGGASAGDFIELARIIKEKVLETSGTALEEEVWIVGE